MVVGISTLIFSRNNVSDVLDLIQETASFADEIVIVDSSSAKNEKILRKNANSNAKVRLYHAVVLGHPEPYQMYGLSKCKYDWIFYIDTDERPNLLLKNNIRRLIERKGVDAYLIRKRELNKEGRKYFDSYQCRLYRKKTATYNGNVFYDPVICGTKVTLENRYFLNHHFEYYEDPSKLRVRYFSILAYEMRESYQGLINVHRRHTIFCKFLHFYCKIKGINKDEELTKFDYRFLFLTLGYFAHTFLNVLHRDTSLKFLIRNYSFVWAEINYLFGFPQSARKIQCEIAKDIRSSGGVIKYLKINEEFIKNITKEYDDGKKEIGVSLFVHLLEAQYSKKRAT